MAPWRGRRRLRRHGGGSRSGHGDHGQALNQLATVHLAVFEVLQDRGDHRFHDEILSRWLWLAPAPRQGAGVRRVYTRRSVRRSVPRPVPATMLASIATGPWRGMLVGA